MIVGSGLLAKAFSKFEDDPAVTIFASGVSNSQEIREDAFRRERDLLSEALNREAKLVYFSSCGVTATEEDSTSYMRHKRAMEALVGARDGSLVLRLPQVVGYTDNPHTLTNFLHNRIVSGEPFTIWGFAERNLIDIEDVVTIATDLLESAPAQGLRLTAIAAEKSLLMPELVAILERVVGGSANCTVVAKGSPMRIEPRLPPKLATALGIDLGEGYAERVLSKYYGGAAGLA